MKNRISIIASLVGVVVGIAAFVGCTDSESGLPVPDGGVGGQSGGAGGGGAAGTGGGGAGGSGGGGIGGGGSGGGGVGGGAGMMTDGPPDFSIPDGLPDATLTDAPPPSPGKIDCGSMSCDRDKEVCCTSIGPGGGSVTEMCIPKGTMCGGAVKVCDGKEDCPAGRLCCFRGSFMGARVECADEKSCTGMGTYPICHTSADCPADRPNCCAISIFGTTLPVCSMYKC